MEPENQTTTTKKDYSLPVSIVIAAAFIAGAWIYSAGNPKTSKPQPTAAVMDTIAPEKGLVLPAVWGDLGPKLTESGVLDGERFMKLLAERGELNEETRAMLTGTSDKKIKITRQNAGALLNFFWALGLANKNEILTQGPMAQYGDVSGFASTGGWTLAAGSVMNHYAAHSLIELTPEQQELVKEVSQNIYRPCCNNPTHFPDCNHGLAMLGMLELAASQGATKEEMYRAALAANAYWFPDQYLVIAQYLKSKNIDWNKVAPEKILGKEFSSASGFQWVQSQVAAPEENGGGGGCGV